MLGERPRLRYPPTARYHLIGQSAQVVPTTSSYVSAIAATQRSDRYLAPVTSTRDVDSDAGCRWAMARVSSVAGRPR